MKSGTKGYASLDYELSGYRQSNLAKMDIVLNGEQVDALSFIVHRDRAYNRGRIVCEKLRKLIPRQMFEVPIQASVGTKVVARETVKAMRKTYLPSVMVVTSRGNGNCLRSRRKVRSG